MQLFLQSNNLMATIILSYGISYIISVVVAYPLKQLENLLLTCIGQGKGVGEFPSSIDQLRAQIGNSSSRPNDVKVAFAPNANTNGKSADTPRGYQHYENANQPTTAL